MNREEEEKRRRAVSRKLISKSSVSRCKEYCGEANISSEERNQ